MGCDGDGAEADTTPIPALGAAVNPAEVEMSSERRGQQGARGTMNPEVVPSH